MKLTGSFAGISKDYISNKFLLTLKVNEDAAAGYEQLKDVENLDIFVDKHKEKRSLDANAYFHVLVGKIADCHTPPISKQRCKNILICRYGQPDFLPDGQPIVIKTNIPVEKMLEQETMHVAPCGVDIQGGKEINFYRVYRGSHTYDTKEMSILIEGTVQEAKDLGIEVATPEELKRYAELWQRKCGAP